MTDDPRSLPPASRRKVLLASAGTLPILAGCGSPDGDDDDGEPAGDDESADTDPDEDVGDDDDDVEDQEEEAEREVEAVIGERVGDERLEFVVEAVDRRSELGEFSEADEGNEFVVVTMAVMNRTDDEFADFNAFMQATLRDDEDYTYRATARGTGRPLESGQIAPGEVARGDVVFEVPEEASGLTLRFDFAAFDFLRLNRVTVDLETEADEIHRLEQSLAIDVNEVGDTVSDAGWEITLNEVRTEQELGFHEPDDGNEYIVANVTVTNETGDDEYISIGFQMVVKDEEGWQYRRSSATHSLDRPFEDGEFEDGETRRGEIAYEVPEDEEPLYWAGEFAMFGDGTKSFWQLR